MVTHGNVRSLCYPRLLQLTDCGGLLTTISDTAVTSPKTAGCF